MTQDRHTVEQHEIAFFDQYYEGKAYNPVGWRLRFARDLKTLQSFVGKRSLGEVLSLGCGDGQFELLIAPYARRVVGLDISSSAIQAANRRRETLRAENVQFRCTSIADLDWSERFDAIVCLGFLHHVPESDLKALLRACHQHLNEAGVFYSQDPNQRGILRTIGRRLMGKRYDAYHSPDERELDSLAMREQLLGAGFSDPRICYVDLTLIPATFILAHRAGWPLYLCRAADAVWTWTPLARWSSGYALMARR